MSTLIHYIEILNSLTSKKAFFNCLTVVSGLTDRVLKQEKHNEKVSIDPDQGLKFGLWLESLTLTASKGLNNTIIYKSIVKGRKIMSASVH